eukprot:scaffold65675_cov85-Phaeocystis_antarctica.AAC.5
MPAAALEQLEQHSKSVDWHRAERCAHAAETDYVVGAKYAQIKQQCPRHRIATRRRQSPGLRHGRPPARDDAPFWRRLRCKSKRATSARHAARPTRGQSDFKPAEARAIREISSCCFGVNVWILLTFISRGVASRSAHTSGWVRGAGTGLEPSLGHDRSRIPAMASSQGDVRSSPMAYPAVRPLPKLPLPLRPETGPRPLSSSTCVRPEHDRAQSCAIALRSPASERPSDLNRYSPDIHLCDADSR